MTSNPPRQRSSPRAGWLAGFVMGAPIAVAVLELGFIGMLIGILALLLIAWKGPRLVAAAGFATGFGGVWTLLFARVMLSCSAENLRKGEGCSADGIEGWVAASIVILVVGLAASVVVARRRRAA